MLVTEEGTGHGSSRPWHASRGLREQLWALVMLNLALQFFLHPFRPMPMPCDVKFTQTLVHYMGRPRRERLRQKKY